MIKTDAEYAEAVARLEEEKQRLKTYKQTLSKELGAEELKRAMDPLLSFHQQLVEEVASYERLKRGEFSELRNFQGFGRLLIALRIASGMTQRQLAERLGVDPSQVSRDERHEYHGITIERVERVLEALRAEVTTEVVHYETTEAA